MIYTSYMSRIKEFDDDKYIKIAITRGKPPEWVLNYCLWMAWLAPEWHNVELLKSGEIDFDEFTRRYESFLNLPAAADEIKNKLESIASNSGKDIILFCWERKQCHRFILGKHIGASEFQ